MLRSRCARFDASTRLYDARVRVSEVGKKLREIDKGAALKLAPKDSLRKALANERSGCPRKS